MSFETAHKAILDLFRIAGKEVPTEDSNTGRAIQVMQSICDAHSHSIPDADDIKDEMIAELEDENWFIFPGNAACNPYAQIKNSLVHIESDNIYDVICKAYAEAGLDLQTPVEEDFFEALETLENEMNSNDDFTFEFDGNEYRLINSDENVIWPIYRDAIQETVEECYSDVIKLDKIPSFIAVSIDWELTARNAYVDGYGHQFSTYDGSEEEAAGWYIFRTN
jgi:hypothetical protein